MKSLRCPICHSLFSLDAVMIDDAQRETWALLLKLPPWLQQPLVQYVGLFRSEKRDLDNVRSLRLMQETLTLHSEPAVLAAALSECVQAILGKRAEGGQNQPLKNHNYLKRILENTPCMPTPTTAEAPKPLTSKTGQAAAVLENMKR